MPLQFRYLCAEEYTPYRKASNSQRQVIFPLLLRRQKLFFGGGIIYSSSASNENRRHQSWKRTKRTRRSLKWDFDAVSPPPRRLPSNSLLNILSHRDRGRETLFLSPPLLGAITQNLPPSSSVPISLWEYGEYGVGRSRMHDNVHMRIQRRGGNERRGGGGRKRRISTPVPYFRMGIRQSFCPMCFPTYVGTSFLKFRGNPVSNLVNISPPPFLSLEQK